MVSWRRWGAVAAGVAVLIGIPPAAGRLSARSSPMTAQALLTAIQGSGRAGYSGYAEADGGLALPLTSRFSGLADLLGGHTRLRVWWRTDRDWRVDAVGVTGETDLHRTGRGAWTWEYESNRATFSVEPAVRLPRHTDLDPAQLGRRLLSEAEPAEVVRLPTRRIAGRDAPGLRLHLNDPQATITRIDVWADPGTGLPVRVEVYGAGQSRPALQTGFLDFDPRTPDPATTAFRPPPGARTWLERDTDVAAMVDEISPVLPPDVLAGYPLRHRVEGLGAVGTYGRGATVLVAVPLPGRVSGPLLDELGKAPGVRKTSAGVLLAVGPLTLLVADAPQTVVLEGDPSGIFEVRSWLLAGTVTADTLLRAAADLAAHPPRLR